VDTILVLLMTVVLGLLVIDLSFGRPFGLARWIQRSTHRFVARFAFDRGSLWFAWAGMARNPRWCLDCLSRAADLGHPGGMREYGRHFLGGGMGTTARAAATPWLRRAAEAGDAEAAFFLGEMLRWGVGAAPRPAEAMTWYLRSAEGGFRPAARWLAHAYAGGERIEESSELSSRWTLRAEGLAGEDQPGPGLLGGLALVDEAGGATATEIMDEVGEALWATRGFRILVVVSASLLLGLAAFIVLAIPYLQFVLLSAGIGLALVMVFMRLLGHHTPLATRQGRKLEARAEALDVNASYQLGLRFEQGHFDAPKDMELARRHFTQAAEAGHAGAALHLADLLSWGLGGPKDVPRARALLDRLARTGHPEAVARLQRLEPGLSPNGPSADPGEEGRSR
jgi:TPR repeat protein